MCSHIKNIHTGKVGDRLLRAFRSFVSFISCWVMLAGFCGLVVTYAAESRSFRLETETDAATALQGTSNHFQINGTVTWSETPMASTHFQIVHGAAEASHTNNTPSSESSASETERGSGGGGSRGSAQLSSAPSTHMAPEVRQEHPAGRKGSLKEATPLEAGQHISAPVLEVAVKETLHRPASTASMEPESGADTVPGVTVPSMEQHPWLGTMTSVEAIITGRLGMIYRSKALLETIPAYQTTGTVIRSIALGARPGFITVESLLLPFGIGRRKTRRSHRRSNLPASI